MHKEDGNATTNYMKEYRNLLVFHLYIAIDVKAKNHKELKQSKGWE